MKASACLSFVFAGLTLIAGCKPPAATVMVDTPVGTIGGNEAGTHQEFLGIPFAQPPVGDLRWRPPQPLPAFAEPYIATRFGAGCTQFSPLTQVLIASEDCLFLNIWRPSGASTPTADSKLPVMVYIHGGAFALGAGSEPQYNGRVLAAKHNVIVVSMNYRMAYLGFLALPELTAEQGGSGNYAFMDQQLALQWVHDNIGAFGGDTDRVMLFGESAGGMSTCSQMASPQSAALIQSAAIQSGFCSANDVLTQSEAEAFGEKFAHDAGCDVADRLACLRGKSIKQITAALAEVGIVGKPFVPHPSIPVVPVIDGKFLTQQPRAALATGTMANKSIIIGINKNEGPLFAAFQPAIPDETAYIAKLESEYGAANAARVAELYPYANYSSGITAYADLQGDRFFVCQAQATADALVNGSAQVYFYHFVQVVSSPLGLLIALLHPDLEPGTFHSTDVPYVFGLNSTLGSISGDERAATSELMQSYWVNNAASGDPAAGGLPAWPLYNATDRTYIELDASPSAASNLKQQKCALLNSLPVVSI
jgi:para-nitrobenzyl esterase